MTCADSIIPYSPCTGDCTRCPAKHRAVIYGPVQSRRRGRSLGINLYPLKKVCSFDCIYCLRGRTIVKACKPEEVSTQITVRQIVKYLRDVLKKVETDTVDLSGNGEPTLYPYLEDLCREVRQICNEFNIKSFGVFTNSSTLTLSNVLKALKYTDHVEAKLDTVIEEKFVEINRPHIEIRLDNIIRGLINVRKNLECELAIQILLLKYTRDDGKIMINYSEKDAENMRDILQKIEPDLVNIYTIYRPVLTRFRIEKPEIDKVNTFVKILREGGLNVRTFMD